MTIEKKAQALEIFVGLLVGHLITQGLAIDGLFSILQEIDESLDYVPPAQDHKVEVREVIENLKKYVENEICHLELQNYINEN